MSSRFIAGLCLAFILAGSPVVAAPAANKPVPAAFHGLWSPPGKSCERGAEPQQLEFTAARMRYGRLADSPVLKLRRPNPREIAFESDMLTGDVYETRQFRFRLSANGRRLTEIGPGGQQVRNFCRKL
jgi:hypothetical protein